MQMSNPSSVPVNQNVTFLLKTSRLGPLQHLPLVEYLHGEHFFRALEFDDAHFAESTPPYDFDDFEIVASQSERFYWRGDRFNWRKEKIIVIM